jgi:hypothetical protein
MDRSGMMSRQQGDEGERSAFVSKAERIELWLRRAVLIAAVATFPLTLAYIRDWTPSWLIIVDWAIWGLFVVEFTFIIAIAEQRWQATRLQWLAAIVILVSFPVWPYLLGLSRLLRLARVGRSLPLVKSVGVFRSVHLGRLYLVRSAGAQVAMPEIKQQIKARGPRIVRDRLGAAEPGQAAQQPVPQDSMGEG